MRVLIAGAGLAGLCAARELARAGVAVTVVDARERAGGRVWTARFANVQHAELGGEFIEAEQEAMLALVRELNLPLVRVLRGGFTHRWRTADGEYEVSRTRPWDELAHVLAPLVRRYEAAGGQLDADAVREMATWSLRAWLREHEAPPDVHAMAELLRGFFLADPDDLSVLPVVQQLADGGSPAQAQMHRIAGGNDRLIETLLATAPTPPLLGHVLRAIAHAPDRVVAQVLDNRGLQQEIVADAVILTLPPPALARVDIQPPLPHEQRLAYERLRAGCATKVLLQSPRDLFAGRRARAFATDTHLGAFWDGAEEQAASGASVITFLAGGSASRRLHARATAAPSAVLRDLCWLGMAGSPVIDSRVVAWEDDPWAGGGYAYFDPGFEPAWRPLLARRHGRLLFAGEHTSEHWQGYMNGAVESGVRAARQLLEKRPK